MPQAILVTLCVFICTGLGAGGSARFYSAFFVGEEGMQYFIKPLIFKSQQKGEEALPDFTFRYKNEIKDSAIVNISIEGPELYKEIDGIAFSNGDEQYELSEVKLLYNSGSKSGYVSRFTAECSLEELHKIFMHDCFTITIYSSKKVRVFIPSGKAKKATSMIMKEVFVIM